MLNKNMAVLAIGAAAAPPTSAAAADRITARWEPKGELR